MITARRRRACIGVLASVLAALAGPGCRGGDDGPGAVPTFEVEPSASFVRKVRAEGVLRAVEATPIASPQDAQGPMKIAWLAPDGTEVAAGDVVVKFDAAEMQRKLADSEDDVSSERQQLDKVALEGAATRSKRELTADLADLEASVAKQFEAHDDNVFSKIEIIEGAIDLEFAEARAEHARRVKRVERSVTSSQRELHEIARGNHSREVEHAKKGLSNLEVTAPHPGILVLERGWRGETVRVGDLVWSGQKLAELPKVASMQAEVFVLEADAGNLVEGLNAEVVVDAHPDTRFSANVKRVDTLAQPRHPNVPVHYFGVTLELEHTDHARMRVGARVSATILVERPAAIVVPRQAVFDRDGKTIVYRESNGDFEPVEVTLGSASAGRVVIESGLSPGDDVALRDPTKDARELLSDSEGAGADRAAAGPGGPP